MSITLKNLQEEFKRYLFTGRNEETLSELVANTKNIKPSLRLDVYRNAYYIRFQEALAHDFPVLLSVMGNEQFGQEMASYLQMYPSTHPSLRYLGQSLPHWLESKNNIGLKDIARIEWAILNAFDAANMNTLAVEQLHKHSPEQWHQLKFTFVPSLSLLKIDSNASIIWEQHYIDLRSNNVESKIQKIELQPTKPAYLVVYRGQQGPAIYEVSSEWYALMFNLRNNLNFGEACDQMSMLIAEMEVTNIAAQCIAHCVANKWCSDILIVN